MNYIKEFQKNNGLVADGIVGKNTLKKFSDIHRMTEEETAHFFGQTDVETGGFKKGSESLYYTTVAGLRSTFYSPFKDKSDAFVSQYLRNSEKCANYVYANRMGNGNEASGDGYKFRGRSAVQLTGRDNYTEFAKSICDPRVLEQPNLLAEEYFFEGALYYFNKNKLWKYCKEVNKENILKVSRAINLGNAFSKGTPHALKERQNRTLKYYNLF